MPVLSGAVTFSRFRVEPDGDAPKDTKRWLQRGLGAHAFEPIDRKSEDERAAGFVELENHDSIEFSAGALFRDQHALFAFRVDTLKVPGAVLKAEMGKWLAAFEKQNGRGPSRAEKNAYKAQVRHELRMRAVPGTKVHDLSWNLKTQQLQIWASSRTAVEEIVLALEEGLKVKLVPQAPAAAAARAGVPDDALRPTPELVGMDVGSGAEVSHGEP